MNREDSKLIIAALVVSVALAGCEANGGFGASANSSLSGSGSGSGAVHGDDGTDGSGGIVGDGSNTDTGFPNDGSVGGEVLEGDMAIAGDATDPQMNFVCTQSASLFEGATTEVGANGLVGAAVGELVSLLGGTSVTDLLNSVSEPNLAIDTDLTTAASMTQTAAGLDLLLGGGTLDSVDLSVVMPEGVTQSPGSYAVFALSFPPSLLDLGLLSSARVVTLLDGEVQEDGALLDTSGLSLLGTAVAGSTYAFVGYKVTLPYDTARLSISSDLLSADAGSNVFVHEMCTAGQIVTP